MTSRLLLRRGWIVSNARFGRFESGRMALGPSRGCSFAVRMAAFTLIGAGRPSIRALLAAEVFASLGNAFSRFNLTIAFGMSAIILRHG